MPSNGEKSSPIQYLQRFCWYLIAPSCRCSSLRKRKLKNEFISSVVIFPGLVLSLKYQRSLCPPIFNTSICFSPAAFFFCLLLLLVYRLFSESQEQCIGEQWSRTGSFLLHFFSYKFPHYFHKACLTLQCLSINCRMYESTCTFLTSDTEAPGFAIAKLKEYREW